jgi:acetyl-CoA acyltransferase
MAEVFVVGASATAASVSPARLAYEAAQTALADAEVLPRKISTVFVGSGAPGPAPSAAAVAVRLGLRRLGLGSMTPDGRIQHVSSSAAEALYRAFRTVESGLEDLVLCIGTADGELGSRPWESWPGHAVLNSRARTAGRYTPAQLARVVIKNRVHGAKRGVACELGLEDVLDGDVLEWPLTRPMVAGSGSGGAAVVLASREAARRIARSRVRIRASALVRDASDGARAARLAYREAGLGPEDLDLAELHDCTAAAELAAYEDLGIVAEGGGGELVESGYTAADGVLPVNLSGGLLSLGERPGASAIAQLSELTRQLRGEAHRAHLRCARAALAHCAGRPSRSEETVVGVTVLTV